MFTTKLSRVAQRATTAASSTAPISTTCASPASATRAGATTCLVSSQSQGHQRRPSSSKASCPPDSNNDKPAPAQVKAAEQSSAQAAEHQQHVAAQQPRSGRRVGRGRRPQQGMLKKKDGEGREVVDQFAGLPTVPGLGNVTEQAYKLTNFFSLHRPVSLTPGQIPPPASEETFAQIFNLKPSIDSWAGGNSAQRRPEDVIYTLHNTIETLDSATLAAEEQGVRWEVLNEQNGSGNVHHLDGTPGGSGIRMKSMEELVATFTPFKAPPPPQPFPQDVKKASSTAADKKSKSASKQAKPKQKSYTTTIVVTESTTPDGQRTYTASSSPIVRIPDSETQENKSIREPGTPARRPQHPFTDRMQRRQKATFARWRISEPGRKKVTMFLISVKRQRKLKMKKHKYKKLMKRTRNLRRRLDRV